MPKRFKEFELIEDPTSEPDNPHEGDNGLSNPGNASKFPRLPQECYLSIARLVLLATDSQDLDVPTTTDISKNNRKPKARTR